MPIPTSGTYRNHTSGLLAHATQIAATVRLTQEDKSSATFYPGDWLVIIQQSDHFSYGLMRASDFNLHWEPAAGSAPFTESLIDNSNSRTRLILLDAPPS